MTATYAYDTNGNRASLTYANGTAESYAYNLANQVTQVENRDGQGAILSSYAYTYDLSGNQVSKTDHTGRSTAYTYDGAGRLTNETETLSGQTVFSAAYAYDLRGNRAQMTVGRAESYTVTYAYDLNNRLLTETKTTASGDTLTGYSYDANGNTLSASTGTGAELYTYDAFNRMTSVENGEGSHTYAYRPDGLRQSKTVGGVTTTHIWDGQNIAAELEGGTLKATYIRGINLLAREDNTGARRYYLYNAHGDVTQLTDNTGGLVWAYDYDAFGNQRALTGYVGADSNPFRYCGEYLDLETGTYYLRARYYDPTIGRFLTQDSVLSMTRKMPNGQEIIDPLSLNLYTYSVNNPIMYHDPSGNAWETVLDVAGLLWSISDMWNDPSWANAGFLLWDVASIVVPFAPGSYVAKGVKAVGKIDDVADTLKIVSRVDNAVDIVDFVKDGNRLVDTYGNLTETLKGTGLHAHHLLEKRFASALGLKANDMMAVALTKSQHQCILIGGERLLAMEWITRNIQWITF